MSFYPYASEYPVMRGLPEKGRPKTEILAELHSMAEREDASWENGKVSGSMYCGDHEHYAFMNEAFGLYGHMNALQRDVCPSSTRFEGELIAMGLDIMHAAGMTTVRIDVSWIMLQPRSRTAYDPWGTSFVDHVIALCNARGITPLIAAAAKAHPDLSESQVRLWVNRGYLPSYRHPDPLAGRRQGRGRSIQRWISASELAAFAGQKKKAAGGDPSAVNEPQP